MQSGREYGKAQANWSFTHTHTHTYTPGRQKSRVGEYAWAEQTGARINYSSIHTTGVRTNCSSIHTTGVRTNYSSSTPQASALLLNPHNRRPHYRSTHTSGVRTIPQPPQQVPALTILQSQTISRAWQGADAALAQLINKKSRCGPTQEQVLTLAH